MENHLASIEQRLERLEKELAVRKGEPLTPLFFALGLATATVAIAFGFHGLKIPNHPYQVVLAFLAVAYFYHQRSLLWPAKKWQWILPLMNVVQLSFVFKVVIGSGRLYPFSWVRYPNLLSVPNQEKWLQIVPQWKVTWEPIALTGWDLDLTVFQTFMLLMTLVGAGFSFQPFASLTACLLLFASLPAFAQFDWSYVFPALFTTAVSFYLQRPQPRD